MKKTTLIITLIFVLILAACGGASASPEADSNQPNNPSDNSLPLSTQLLLGTFKLDGTDLTVDSEQASELIPLWLVLQSLSNSDSVAQEEVDALVEQIQETMTPEQMQAIEEMGLTPEDMFTIMQDQGIEGFAGRGFAQSGGDGDGEGLSPPEGFTPPDGGPAGGGPGGGFGGGGGPGGGLGGQNLSPEQIATAQAAREQNGGGFRFNNTPAPLIEALIEFLQAKAGA